MESIKTRFVFYCHECGEIKEWNVEHALIDYHGLTHIYTCKDCGKKVPAFAMDRYQEEGRVLIPV